MFARIGVMKALNRHIERLFNPDRKHHQPEAEAERMKPASQWTSQGSGRDILGAKTFRAVAQAQQQLTMG
jgi:hypothetical protein